MKKTIDLVKKFTAKHKNKLGILFIDEIDTLLQSRKNNRTAHSEDASVVNTFLSEMDSIEGTSNVIIIGASNFSPNELDEAAMSRFDKKIFFNLPSLDERKDIISKIVDNQPDAKKKYLDSKNFSIENFAKKIPGGSGRDIETILNEAVRKAISKNSVVDDSAIHNEIANLALGAENKSLIIPEERKRVVAFHELGHAYIGKWNGKIAETVTMIPRGPTLGTAWILEKDDNVLKTKADLENEIQELCAGRMAENIFCNTETTGASNDYERIKKIAFDYFLVYNFDYNGSRLYTLEKDVMKIPQTTLEKIHALAAQLIAEQENKVREVLTLEAENIRASFELLMTKETIGHDEIFITPKTA